MCSSSFVNPQCQVKIEGFYREKRELLSTEVCWFLVAANRNSICVHVHVDPSLMFISVQVQVPKKS